MTIDAAAVILAGGQGSRIGGDKPLRTLRGERLIDRVFRQARCWSELVAVAVRDRAQIQPTDALILIDEPRVAGPLGGLISALEFGDAVGCDCVLTIAADMPLLPADLLDRLARAIGERDCALAASGRHLHPVCGLWRTAALRHIATYVDSDRRSLKGLAETLGFETVEWPAEPIDPFLNINTADDLRVAESLL